MQAIYADGVTRDVTEQASYTVGNKLLAKFEQFALTPVADGQTELRIKFQGKALTVVVTATRATLPPGTATSAAVTVKFTSTTGLSLSRSVLFSGQRTTATITVTSGAPTLPAGRVVVSLGGRTLTELAVAAGSTGMVTYRLPKKSSGVYQVQATFVPTGDTVAGSTSPVKRFVVFATRSAIAAGKIPPPGT